MLRTWWIRRIQQRFVDWINKISFPLDGLNVLENGTTLKRQKKKLHADREYKKALIRDESMAVAYAKSPTEKRVYNKNKIK